MTPTEEEPTEVWKALRENSSEFVAKISAVLAAELAAAGAARLAPDDFVATFARNFAAKITADPVFAADPALDANVFAIESLSGIPAECAKNAAAGIAANIAGAAAFGTAAGDLLGAPYFARIAETAIVEAAETDRREFVQDVIGRFGTDRNAANMAIYFAYYDAVSPAIVAAAPGIAANDRRNRRSRMGRRRFSSTRWPPGGSVGARSRLRTLSEVP